MRVVRNYIVANGWGIRNCLCLCVLLKIACLIKLNYLF